MRKAIDDVLARAAAESLIGRELYDNGKANSEDAAGAAAAMVTEFKAVEFEETERQIGDEKIHLRRLVLTGPWEVDPSKGR